MSILAKLEKTLEGLVEGVFRRGFKGSVQPVEIGRRLVREMEENRRVSISRTYVPNVYQVYLHPADKENLDALASTLRSELADHLQQAAERGSYFFVSPPQIAFLADENLDQGSIVIHSSFCEEEDSGTGPMIQGKNGLPVENDGGGEETTVFKRSREVLLVVAGPDKGKELPINQDVVTMGRGHDNTLVLSDISVSRHHARLERLDGGTFRLVDLDSLNGTYYQKARVKQSEVKPGDQFRLGTTVIELRAR